MERSLCLDFWRLTLSSPELVLYHCSLHRSWITAHFYRRDRLLFSPYPRAKCAGRRPFFHCQIDWRHSVLQEMSSKETRPCAPLFDLQAMCNENGSSLPLACDLRWITELQVVSIVSDIYEYFLLAMFRYYGDLALG